MSDFWKREMAECWSHCPTCGRATPGGFCGHCLIDGDEAKILDFEWVSRKPGTVACRVCNNTASYKYRALAKSAAQTGNYCGECLPLNDELEAHRVLRWLNRKAGR